MNQTMFMGVAIGVRVGIFAVAKPFEDYYFSKIVKTVKKNHLVSKSLNGTVLN